MRRNVLTVLCIAGLALGAGTLGGCATDKEVSVRPSSQGASEAPRPRRHRLCSGDSLGLQMLEHDPSLSSADMPWTDRATAGFATE